MSEGVLVNPAVCASGLVASAYEVLGVAELLKVVNVQTRYKTVWDFFAQCIEVFDDRFHSFGGVLVS